MHICQETSQVRSLHETKLQHFPDAFPEVKIKIARGAFTRWEPCNRKPKSTVTYENELQDMSGQLWFSFTCKNT